MKVDLLLCDAWALPAFLQPHQILITDIDACEDMLSLFPESQYSVAKSWTLESDCMGSRPGSAAE